MEITNGQKTAVVILMQRFTGIKSMQLKILSKFFDRDIESLDDLDHDDWVELRDTAYPKGAADNWKLSRKFKNKVKKYIDEIMGQEKLF